ncbi:alanine-zipper protein, partial [Bartonella sp. AP213QHHD]
MKKTNKVLANAMTVVFATYQLIQVIADAQEKYGLSEFDLIICEAVQVKADKVEPLVVEAKEVAETAKITAEEAKSVAEQAKEEADTTKQGLGE